MAKCKQCPYKRTCRNECYGEQPCDFALAFDRLAHKLDLKTACVASLQADRAELRMVIIRPITLREANAFVAQYHRHNQPTTALAQSQLNTVFA